MQNVEAFIGKPACGALRYIVGNGLGNFTMSGMAISGGGGFGY